MLVAFWEYSNKDGQMAWQNLYRMLNGLGQVEIYFGIPQLKAICPKFLIQGIKILKCFEFRELL